MAIKPTTFAERQAILDVLQEMRDGRFDNEGGYPAVISDRIPGYVVIADVDHDEAPHLTVYQWRDLHAWYRRALRWHRENPDEKFVYAMMETEQVRLPCPFPDDFTGFLSRILGKATAG